MRVLSLEKIGQAANAGKTFANFKEELASFHQATAQAQSELDAPLELNSCTKVTYDSKTDRYTATFSFSGKTATLKTSNDVATFLTQHLRTVGTWRGRMQEGVLVDAYLITI